MSAARILSLAVIVFFMAVIGLLWTALNKVSTIQQTVKVAAEAASKRVCKRLDLSDDLDLLGYSGCRIELDCGGMKLQPGQKLLLKWQLQTLKGTERYRPARSGDFPGSTGGMLIARGGDGQAAPGKVELAVAYRRSPKPGSEQPFHDIVSGHQRIRINGRPATAGEFSAEVRDGSAEIVPFWSKEFPLNEPFTMVEYVFGPTGDGGQRIVDQQITLRWLAEVSIVDQP